VLGKKHGARPEIEASDEGYCEASKQILKDLFKFTFHDRLDALLHVDEHTFVFCMKPSEAISQFVINLCHGEGGPAALLNGGVFNDGRCILQSAPGEHISGCGEDYSSPQLYAWVKNCQKSGRHISIEERYKEEEEEVPCNSEENWYTDEEKEPPVHVKLATFGQVGAELY
jgi:hypothetical protein